MERNSWIKDMLTRQNGNDVVTWLGVGIRKRAESKSQVSGSGWWCHFPSGGVGVRAIPITSVSSMLTLKYK